MKRSVVVLMLCLSSFCALAQLNFEKPATINWLSPEQNFIEYADFDGDGKMDIAISSANSTFITLMLQAERFTPQRLVVGDAAPQRGIVGEDFDGDAFTDMIVTDFTGNGVVLFKGKANRKFEAPVKIASGNQPVDVTLVDFDNDDDMDLLVANRGANSITVLQNASGTFTTKFTLTAGTQPENVKAEDLNGDGFDDVVVVNKQSSSVSVFLNQAGTAFGTGTALPVRANPSKIQFGDMNGDSKKDIVVSHAATAALSILFGAEPGTFSTAVEVTLPHEATGGKFSVADLNSDGIKDIVLVARNPSRLMFLFNNGVANFTKTVASDSYSFGFMHDAIATPGLNASEPIRVFTTIQNSIRITAVVLDATGTPKGYFEYFTDPFPNSVDTGDFNGDGSVDVAIGNFYYGNYFSVLFGENGKLDRDKVVNVPSHQDTEYGVVAGDMDNDGYSDIVAFSALTLTIYYGSAENPFAEKKVLTSPTVRVDDVALADINNDGKLDISTGSAVHLATGARTYSVSTTHFDPRAMEGTTLIDMNKDGKLDKLFLYGNGGLYFLAGNGNGTFDAPVWIASAPLFSRSLSSADFNNDGYMDVAFVNLDTYKATIVLGASTTAGMTASTFIAGEQASNAWAGDFNDDQKVDLMVSYLQGVRYFKGNGDGTFEPQSIELVTLFNPKDLLAADLDKNGKLDLITCSNSVNGGTNTLSIVLGDRSPTLAASELTFTNVTFNSATLNWKKGNGSQRIIIAKKTQPITATPQKDKPYLFNAIFGTGPDIGTSSYVVYNGTAETVTVTGLEEGEIYHFSVVEYNTLYDLVSYNTRGILAGSVQTPVSEPTQKASSFAFFEVANETWTNGNGDARIIIMRKGAEVNAVPTDNVAYTADATFGTGQQIGEGNYVVFNGSEATVNLKSIENNVIYHYRIIEYNKSSDSKLLNYQADFHSGQFTGIITGLEDTKIEVNVFPNPFNNVLKVTTGDTEPFLVDLLDLRGVPAISTHHGSGEITVNASSMPDGLYILRVTKNGVTHTQRLIKR